MAIGADFSPTMDVETRLKQGWPGALQLRMFTPS